MTQTELDDLLGVSKQAVSKMEQTKKIDDSRLNYIADVLGVTPEVIRTFKEEIPINGCTPRTNNHWGFHLTKLNSRQGRRTKNTQMKLRLIL
jgi:transcriptional regulator with XRE-family HTH domain